MTKVIPDILGNSSKFRSILIITLSFALSACANLSATRAGHDVASIKNDDAIPINDIIKNIEAYHGKRVKFRAFLSASSLPIRGLFPFSFSPYGPLGNSKKRCYSYPESGFSDGILIIGTGSSRKEHRDVRITAEKISEVARVEVIAYGTVKNESYATYAVAEIYFSGQINDIKITKITDNICETYNPNLK